MLNSASNSTPHHWLNAPLAIVGMACRLPGADGLEAFWQLLHQGGYPIEPMPDSKLDRERYFHPEKGQRGKTYADVGGFVAERELDWSLLNLSPAEAQNWDECHLNFCEVAAQACRHAGYDPRNLSNRRVGVFVGHSGGTTLGGELAYRAMVEDYLKLLDDLPEWPAEGGQTAKRRLSQLLTADRPQRVAGRPWVEAGFSAGLVSHVLGLTGPHMAIDAACASSLVALGMGAMAIHSGQSDMAIIGGASFNKTDSLILFSNAQSCSASMSRPFDDRADGLISSEGYVALVIKSLAQAQADGDPIQAVLHGIGISTDGRGRSLWAPRKEGQYTAIERAYSADVSPASVQMVEAHATSTPLGDATEMEALATFYGKHLPAGTRLPVGSVKSNIGHTLETAGLAGVVKAVLAMQQGVIPPSINVEQLSRSIPWQDIPLSVVRAAETWPSLPAGQPRRAAVNAFGIGGLNVHVVVEQPPEQPHDAALQNGRRSVVLHAAQTAKSPVDFEPIAIIGRGLVLPGALDVGAYQAWLAQSFTRPVGGPAGSASAPQPPAIVALIDDFQYDWRKHKVPPKQIAQANPLQFMLLEAAEQALREAGLLHRDFDRQHTAVVVGNVFGGDFGNALFGGLRLPELRERLLQALAEQGCNALRAQALADAYETHFLKRYPALLDETGSFTSSTLASRLSKTYDLMGGALAIDAGDTSSFAALNAACQLLHSGEVKMVVCAAAQLACDRAALENLAQRGHLHRRGAAREPIAVGQGVALVLLKPLSAARRDGDQVLGVIDGLGVGFDAASLENSIGIAVDQMAARRVAAGLRTSDQRPLEIIGGVGLAELDRQVSAGAGMTVTPSRNLGLTGFLHGAQGLVDLIGVTLEGGAMGRASGTQLIAAHTQSGQSYVVSATAAIASLSTDSPAAQADQTLGTSTSAHSHRLMLELPVNTQGSTIASLESPALSPISATSGGQPAPSTYRLSAASLDELKQQLALLASSPVDNANKCAANLSNLTQWRAAIICVPDKLPAQARKLALLVGSPQSSATAIEQGLLWSAPHQQPLRPARVAWLFPGQGSQYTGMLFELCREDTAAAKAVGIANRALADLGQPSFDELAWASSNQLGEDVWHTQAAMLVADWILLESLRSRGFTADVVSGHSFGEFAAMLAAGCWDLSAALRATYERCRAIVEYVPAGCAMLSVQADAATVANAIAASGLPMSISHRNAPQQTVVGGKQSHIAQLAQSLDNEGLTSRLLPVPTAFHTAALQPAERPFREALESIEIHPPQTPLLSSVDNRFVAEPASIRDGLAKQLTTPLDFVALTDRLIREGVTLAVEVGPQTVLSRLVRQTTGQLCIVSTDHVKLGASYQLQIVTAMCELHGVIPTVSAASAAAVAPLANSRATSSANAFSAATVISSGNRRTPMAAQDIVHFDATTIRRSRLRSAGQVSKHVATGWIDRSRAEAPQHFDATQTRRQQRRHAAANEIPETHTGPALQSHKSALAPHQSAPSAVDAVGDRSTALSANSPTAADKTGRLGKDATPSASSANRIETFLIDFVVEQTGYPAEIIELDWDIEADLGIDSIKKAQLFGELREFFDLESHAALRLDDYRSLRDIADLLHSTPGKADWLSLERETSESRDGPGFGSDTHPAEALVASPQRPATPPTTVQGAVTQPTMSQPSAAQSNVQAGQASTQHSVSELSAFLVDFVVEQTGYPPEIVELDADLEADLGIDSIKKAQLFGELREMFAIDPASLVAGNGRSGREGSRGGMDEIRTLRQILDALLAQQDTLTTASTDAADDASQAPVSTSPDGGAIGIQPVAPAANTKGWTLSPLPSSEVVPSTRGESQLPLSQSPASQLPFSQLSDHSQQIPCWESGNNTADSEGTYAAGLRANLRALVARRDAAPLAGVSTSARWSEYQVRIDTMSTIVAADPSSLQALERALVGQVRWLPIFNLTTSTASPTCPSANHSANLAAPAQAHASSPNVVWLANWQVPNWLATSGAALGLDLNRSGQVELDAIGSVSPLAVLTGTLLCVAGLNESPTVNGDTTQAGTSESYRKISQLVLELRGSHIDELTDQVRRWQLSCDWWVIAVDAHTRRLTHIESRAGVIALENASLDELACETADISSTLPTSHSSVARIGVDRVRGRFVVECAVQPPPYPRIIQELPELPGSGPVDEAPAAGVAKRYVLRMVPAPQRVAVGRQPTWAGTAVVVGDNPVAYELQTRLRDADVDVVRWDASEDPRELARRFVDLTTTGQAPHLFLTTPCDEQARFSLDEANWRARRSQGVLGNFWLCQAWFEHVSKRGLTDSASLLLVSTLGGSFGIEGDVVSIEGGGLDGMLKSILIESWMQGYRALPIKTIDTSPDQSPRQIVDALWRELAIPSYDNEIAIIAGQRHVLRAVQQPLVTAAAPTQLQATHRSLKKIARGGNWVCTGGARGITAFVAEKLAERYGLTLHLLGTAPQPSLDTTWQQLTEPELKQLKVRIMTEARTAGRNPVKTWQDTEKSLEIDATLRRLASLGIEAHYHSCDVADRSAVSRVLTRVRQLSGPIHGVLHGAGVGKDSRFDRKQDDKVNQCIAAKVDGALSLMAATAEDPLECFIGFGSISGRFGANGHTDYSLANEMLCKTIDAYQTLRPDCRAIGFHWHAWGDIGMATKPETKLALEMIDMQFMPAQEGVAHLIDELERGTGEREVLITDERYYRMFYPAETLIADGAWVDVDGQIPAPLLSAATVRVESPKHNQPNASVGRTEGLTPARNAWDEERHGAGESTWTATVRPIKDPFLTEHKLDGRPLLPFVVAAEMLLEAGQRQLETNSVMLQNVTARAALRFFGDAPQDLRIEARTASQARGNAVAECRLLSDFMARDGRLVEANRINFTAQVVALDGQVDQATTADRGTSFASGDRHVYTQIALPARVQWQPAIYPEIDGKFYVGWPLQRLKKVALVEGGIVGRISAPALIELAGTGRDVRGWRIPSAALDACLFAVGILAWQQVAPGSALPVRIGQLKLGRLPSPGEACEVHARLRSSDGATAMFDFTLVGVDGTMLVDVVDYQVAWLGREQALPSELTNAERRTSLDATINLKRMKR